MLLSDLTTNHPGQSLSPMTLVIICRRWILDLSLRDSQQNHWPLLLYTILIKRGKTFIILSHWNLEFYLVWSILLLSSLSWLINIPYSPHRKESTSMEYMSNRVREWERTISLGNLRLTKYTILVTLFLQSRQ